MTQNAICFSIIIGDVADAGAEIDPYELMEAVDILSKLPKDYFDKIVSLILFLSITRIYKQP